MAVRIDGSSDYVGRSASLPTPPPVTMAGWAQFVNDRNNFSSIVALSASPRTNGQLCLQTDATGTAVNLWYDSTSISVLEPATGFNITIGTPFFWALVCEGTGANQVKAYFRNRTSNTFDVAFTATTGLGAGYTPVLMRFGNADTNENMDGRLWNIKVWDRALTSKELLGESFYRQVLYPANLHLHYLLQGAGTPIDDTFDYSGNGKTATFNGTLVTEPSPTGLWVPRRRILIARGSSVAITGTMAVTEAADVAAISGKVKIKGTLARTEGTDTAAISGDVKIHGSLARTEGQDTAAISGDVKIKGTLALTDGIDAAAIAGKIKIHGTIARTDGQDTAALSGKLKIHGHLAGIEPGIDTAAISGKVIVGGDLAALENVGQDVAAASGKVIVQGDLAATEGHDVGAFNGTEDHIGGMDTSDAPDVSLIAGKVKIKGTMARTEAPDLAALSGEIHIKGHIAVTEARDSSSMTGLSEPPDIIGSVAATEGHDHSNITAIVMIEPGEDIERWEEPYVSAEASRFGITHGPYKNTELVRSSSKNGDVEVTYVRNTETSAPISVVPGQS